MRTSSLTRETETLVLTAPGREQLQTRLARCTSRLAELAEQMRHGEPSQGDRDEHRRLLGHMDELTTVLRRARDVAEVDEDPTIVEVGDEVDIEFDDATVGSYMLVHPVEVSSAGARISAASPLGRALLGARAGDRVTVRAPSGAYQCLVRERRRLT